MRKFHIKRILYLLAIMPTHIHHDILAAQRSSAVVKAPLVITIHGSAKTIYQQSDCDPLKNNPDDSCECCLMTEYTINHPEQTGDAIVQTCIAAKKCSDTSITSLKKTKKVGTGSAQNLLTALYDDVIIRPMVFDTSLLQDDGNFSEQSLSQFLAQAYKENKLPHADFSKADCIKVKNIASQGGYNTLQLFLVTTTCSTGPASMYIVKESKDGIEEATKLKEITQIPQFRDIIAPKVKSGLPTLSLPLAYFAYPDKQTVHYLSAMPSAKGKEMGDWVAQYQQNPSPQNKELLKRAFFILGKETANFHKIFNKSEQGKILGTTVVHGDLHLHNLFFDEITGHFTFIDNETIATYFKKRVSPAVDICKLCYRPFNNTYDDFVGTIEGIDLKTWYDTTFKSFIAGYISAYPVSKQKQLLEEIKTMVNTVEVPAWVHFYDLAEVRKNNINPIFDELMKAA